MASLNRIILINTHLKGVVELVLDDHTNICGTNASGKTTLQRLVPVFYGEYPSRVVPSTRDSFERWYLPTEQSYIIYEYKRPGGQLAQAVLASAGDGKGVNYRFIGKGFELDDYVKSRQGDSLTFLTMQELGRELKRAGTEHSNLINSTSQFKAVIQNDRSLLGTGGNRSELRHAARLFSLCQPEHSLRHIEKLAKAVHSKEGKMETIKSMIAAILEEDGVTPPTSKLRPQLVEAWIRESQLIQGFNAIRPEFDKLEQEFEELGQCELRLSGLTQGYKTDEPRQWQAKEQNENLIEELGFRKNQLENSWKGQRDALNQSLSRTQSDLKTVSEELDRLEEQHQAYMDADIEQAKADLERIPAWQNDLNDLRQRHKLQTENHLDVQAAYKERLYAITQQLNAVLEELSAQQESLQEQRSAKLQQQGAELTELDQGFDKRRQQGLDTYREKIHQLDLEYNAIQARIEGAAYLEEERQTLLVLDERIYLAEEAMEGTSAKVEQLGQQERQLLAKREEANESWQQASRRVIERQSQLDDIKQHLYPGHHSLLEFLRRESPQWETRLGKVISPELLHRSDLKPSLGGDNDSLFGVQLDLAALDIPEHAQTEQALRQRLEQAEAELEEAQSTQHEAEDLLVAAGQALNALREHLILARTKEKNAKEERRRLVDERKAQQDKINAALAERKLQGKKQLSALDSQRQQRQSDHQLWLDQLKEQALEARMEKTAYWQEVVGAMDEQLKQLKAQIQERRARAKEEEQACEKWYRQELKSQGIDETAIFKLEQEITSLEKRINSTEQRRAKVAEFNNWYQYHWLQRKPRLQQEHTELQSRSAELDQQLKDATSQYKQQRSELEQAGIQAGQALAKAEDYLSKIKSLLRRMGEIKLPKEGVDAMGGLDERLALGEDLLQQRDQHQAAVKAYVDRFDSVIASQSGSSLSETWERSREQCTLVNDKGFTLLDYRKLVPELKQLLQVLVPQSVTALREQGRIFGDDLNKYHQILADIDRRIASQSTRITREVGEELFLDGVSDSAVRIRSKISELEFWPELQAFIRAYKAWQADGFTELPNEDYTSAMRRALDIIGRSALAGSIANLLEIELRLREGNSDLVIRTDRQLGESSSHGMAYLILCKFLLAFTRLLRGNTGVTIHWPIDELGTLHYNNVKKIFDACTNNNIRVLGAFPNPDSEVLGLFANRYIVNKQTRQLQVVKPKHDPIAERLKLKERQREVV
ncbi:ATP-binding protein [Gallaecimonas pentaromativorans]|uniref:Uncharacterized protein DUF3584 n=1 Tax=Gallaecimonas pentaromativorans TaxID=584787 RepID=A0A3N1PR19_9GAMM|nr:ATP-binding protein [Gallaecimonas pentaromativorans]ROQ30448.1 uncharacterized protein DUF3584 [Gallaecimonas pentaromativorans]